MVWLDQGPGERPRYLPEPEGTAFLEQVARERPVVPHGIGLSIGSAHRFDREHVEQMARWHEWLRFPWHSDHLSFHLAEPAGEWNVNLTLPLPLDEETLELVSSRVAEVRRRIGVPFLLENNVYYFAPPAQDYDEGAFFHELARRSGCGLLLDLHNVYVNCRNSGGDPRREIDRYPLDSVVELHVAGGMEFGGFYLDAHSGPSPRAVFDLLDWVLPRCPRVAAVTFELFGTWYGVVGAERLRRQLGRMKEAWARHRPAPARAAS